MIEIVNELPKVPKPISIEEVSEHALREKIVIVKQGEIYGILSKTPCDYSTPQFYFKALNSTTNCWPGQVKNSAKEVIQGFMSEKDKIYEKFYIFDDMKEFAEWFVKELNEN